MPGFFLAALASAKLRVKLAKGGVARATKTRSFQRKERNMTPVSVSIPSAAQGLRQSPIRALRMLDVQETDSGVVISGKVSSYYLKQLAQETILPLLDHRSLVNRVTVVRG